MNKLTPFLRTLPLVALAASLLVAPLQAQQARKLSLRQAVQLALRQNPDLLLARIEQEKALQSVAVAKSAFSPTAAVGSGLGYSEGIPQSIEGATPSIVQATGRMPVYDRSLRKRVREAEAMSEAAKHGAAARQDEIAFAVAEAYLDFELASRRVKLLASRLDIERSAEAAVAARVEEGRVIGLELSRARLETARAVQALEAARSERLVLEAALAGRIGLPAETPLEPLPNAPEPVFDLPASAAEGVARAIDRSSELESLRAAARSKEFAVEAEQGATAPRLDFVAQYSMLARFNNFEDFFNRFQRHNGQIGLALQVPIFTGRAVSSRVAKASIESREAELRLAARTSGVELESVQLFHRARQAQADQTLAKQELDYARENLDVLLARHEEGLVSAHQIDLARGQELGAWELYFDAQYALRKARLNLLRRTGELAAALGPE